jgi:hypothetical protein
MVFGLRFIGAVVSAIAILAVVLVVAFSCGGGGADSGGGGNQAQATPEATATSTSANTPEAAVQRFIETTLQKQYAGDCTQAQAGAAAGKLCSTSKGERSGQRAYILGPALSEPTNWVIVGQQNGAWQILRTVTITADNKAVPGTPWALAAGAQVVVIGTGTGLNVREGPALAQKAVDSLPDGTKIKLSAGPVIADGLEWWQVDGRTGWVSADYLRYPDATQ